MASIPSGKLVDMTDTVNSSAPSTIMSATVEMLSQTSSPRSLPDISTSRLELLMKSTSIAVDGKILSLEV